jgi:hypothetical protein
MPKPQTGVSDKLNLKVTNPPEVRITNLTQVQFRKLLLEHIAVLAAPFGFELVTEPDPEDRAKRGVEFMGSISGKGSSIFRDKENRIRPWEQAFLQFEIKNRKPSKLIVPKEFWVMLDKMKLALLGDLFMQSLSLKVWPRVLWTEYSARDDLPPRFAELTIEYYPPEQKDFDAAMLQRKMKEAKLRSKNFMEDLIREVKKEEKSHA